MEKRIKISLVIVITILCVIFIITYVILPFTTMTEDKLFSPILTGNNLTEYENSCLELNVSQLATKTASLKGQKVKTIGQIFKKQEFTQFNKTGTYIELKVPGSNQDIYILVSSAETNIFTEGDWIKVYGECTYPVQTTVSSDLSNKNLVKINAIHINLEVMK
jgi:hypothetical protein